MDLRRQNTLVDLIVQSLAWRETFFYNGKTRTVAQKLNNPICLERWKDPRGEPYPEVNGYAEFPKCEILRCVHRDHPCEVGWRAARAQVKINVFKRRLTWIEFFSGRRGVYEGFSPVRKRSDPVEYANFVMGRVARAFGVETTLNTTICSLVEPATKEAAR